MDRFNMIAQCNVSCCALWNVGFSVCLDMVDPLALVEEEAAAKVDPLQESLATLEKGCEKSTGTSVNFQSFKRTSTRNTPTLVADHW